jgi:hypothetical protein
MVVAVDGVFLGKNQHRRDLSRISVVFPKKQVAGLCAYGAGYGPKEWVVELIELN